MQNKILMHLENLPLPLAVTALDAKQLLQENIEDAKKVLGAGWIPLESDPYVKNLKILTLRQLHNQEQKNITVRRSLVTVATGTDLDHLGLSEHVERLDGVKPIAKIRLAVNSKQEKDLFFSNGTVFTDEEEVNSAVLLDDIVLRTGELFVDGEIQLDALIESSPVKCEEISNFDEIEVKQLTDFLHGAEIEDDNRYRVRIMQSSIKYNTTGSDTAYRFHTYSADSRVDDVEIGEGDGVKVPVYIYSRNGVTDELRESVSRYLNQKHLKPLNDNPVVLAVDIVKIKISVDLYIFNLHDSKRIKSEVEAALIFNFYIGKSFPKSEFISKCHVLGVYEAITSFNGFMVSKNEIIEIEDIKINIKKAVL